ncbi:MAG: M14 family zinc carboxypeptidase, partial [Flavobacteriales bacterium]|nr:M14 family zinc carboxypeptidase [Flavobacteriales bacterium]
MLRIILSLLFLPFFATAQITRIDSIFKNAGEVYFSFEVNSKEELNSISKIVSLDHGAKLPKVFAYANKRTFTHFLALNIPYKLEASPGSKFTDLNMLLSLEAKQLNNWDFYPSYNVYLEMMYAFEDQYPDLCKVTSIGNTVDGRELLVAKLTDSLT